MEWLEGARKCLPLFSLDDENARGGERGEVGRRVPSYTPTDQKAFEEFVNLLNVYLHATNKMAHQFSNAKIKKRTTYPKKAKSLCAPVVSPPTGSSGT